MKDVCKAVDNPARERNWGKIQDNSSLWTKRAAIHILANFPHVSQAVEILLSQGFNVAE
ncbi:hypothetical protein [Actinotignum urinale]|uniref:hypothetical protein n=1 Tax=Actinotignum urinale TaxID=190146 RepID=UPI0003B761F5|nr:hypothetical protein [Actinotignum urinale]MDY5159881.1 hypothetical protein [Actinotignum urinale]